MTQPETRSIWLGRGLTSESAHVYWKLQRRMKKEPLRQMDRSSYAIHNRSEITYANMPEIQRLRNLTHDEGLQLGNLRIIQAIRDALPATKYKRLHPRIEGTATVRLTYWAQHPYIMGAVLESSTLNSELMAADSQLSDMVGATIERDYHPRIVPFARFSEKQTADAAALWLRQLLPDAFALVPCWYDRDHTLEPDNYTDSVISQGFALTPRP